MEKLTIYELTKYYVNRYGLPTHGGGTPGNPKDGMGAYHKKITLLLQKAHVAETSLYDAMLPEGDPKGTRVISVEEFERYCLKDFAEYIQHRYPEHKTSVLLADMDRWQLEHDREYWDKKAKEADQREADVLALGLYDPDEEDNNGEAGVTEEKVFNKGHELMLEALFYKFYGDFEWKKLARDMMFAETPSGAEINGDVLRCRYRLKNFLNYVVIDEKK